MKEKVGTVLIVDDERDHADGLAEAIEKVCARTLAVYTGRDALELVDREDIDVIVTDLKLEGDVDGLDILHAVTARSPHPEVILITAHGSIDTCKQAIKQGAYDYLSKPIDVPQLRTLVVQAARKAAAQLRIAAPAAPDGDFVFEGIQGNVPAMKGIFDILKRVAPTNISVLIEGESGTGKELLARAIHANSKRWNKPFRPINCAGLTETLLESELFGHVKGAFTGAMTDRKGLFEIADKGTLFLDEIGDMPLNMQAKLLRVLEDGVVVPVGSTRPTVVDVRVISATNQNLAQLVEDKKFRQDLYFRIKGVNITLPALRQRPRDISDLVNYFIDEAASETGVAVGGITDAALNVLVNYDWPGNIRQLRNTIRTMVVMCDRDRLDVRDIPAEIHRPRQLTGAAPAAGDLGGMSLSDLERQAILDTLAQTEGNREKAAKMLGIGERTLYRKIKEFGLG
ncbi:MAG TPA: sigma-54-dependent Fis family transcriptional regulator [Phycisphaerales bacterium]|nr:sigma-54-dependent Fis family transcriptional regulator [Phycisphaerales bacterium]